MSMYCEYYQAQVNVPYTWFIGGLLRSEDNLVFERTLDNNSGTIEFFIPQGLERQFLDLMDCLIRRGYVYSYEKLPNRLQVEQEKDNVF